ncbi:MAG: hypothetical protein CVT64_10450 [Actinobacteria bacterium HGW-Actinobacteria-4]|nr:MAG: hypothetical protein CVT64_10450 [Actinobacteria bacterium HGW-Actinobacteria-4]
MSPNKNKAAAAQAMKAQREAIERRERRNRIAIWGSLVVLMGALAVGAGLVLADSAAQQRALAEAAAQPIDGIVETTIEDAYHAEDLPDPAPDPVTGTVLPPMGGPHDFYWQNCGIYTQPIRATNAMHSMEHGAVWIAYHPELAADQVDLLTTKVKNRAYTLLSPVPNLASPVVLTAWGLQLELDDADDDRLDVFLTKYIQGPQTPEPGASCQGGVGTPQ